MSTNIPKENQHDTSAPFRNELYEIKEQQKSLKEREKELKAEVLSMMVNTNLHKDANGIIEKISRKPKSIYDRGLLEQELKKLGFPDDAIEAVIQKSTRKFEVHAHLSVKIKNRS